MAEKYGGLLAKQKGVLGVVISGSLARGDVWEGSDVDLHVLWRSKGCFSSVGGFLEGVLINVHDVWVDMMEAIVEDIDCFCRSDLPDQLYGCRILYDPYGLWNRYKAFIDSKRFDPKIIACKVNCYVEKAMKLLAKAEESFRLKDWASSVFYAQRAAIETAFGITVKCGDLIRSANRFPENLKALTERNGLEELYKLFRSVHGLTGRIEEVEKVITACEIAPKKFIEELDRIGISMGTARCILGDKPIDEALRYKDISELLIKRNLRSWVAVKYGYYNGQIIWMRTNRWIVIPLWASRLRMICGADRINLDSSTIAEDMRRFPRASDVFYNLFLDFLCLSNPESKLAWERIHAVSEMISSLSHS
ncbi:TPA: hypothetical protein ENG04_02750 [Candidatus Poribacteria bacterium]|nr:hypothetical protein [Candidatus Poribacteria bacterium]HEX28984.1 hypothetical protein [Candidatus Poribacteria bacterium]